MTKILNATRVSALFLLSAALSFAQFESGSVLGTITDPSGNVVSGAAITLTNVSTGTSQTSRTDASGSFLFVNQRLGSYRVRAEQAGFKTSETDPFQLTVDARQRVDLTLEIGAVSESVTVTGAAEILEGDSSSRG